jgi:predicted alpha/beta hydrolase
MESSAKAIEIEKFQTECVDGVILKGVLLLPKNPKAVIQFNGGTATKKEFYLPFLEYLAQHNYICCLWDYRGSGESAPSNLKSCDFTYSDYGLKDMPAIKKYLNVRFAQLPFLFFNHSAGGQQIGLMNNLENVAGAVNFAVSTGYLPNMPLGYRLRSGYFFHIFTPLSIWFAGYLKAKQFGYMEDLPKNVVNEWKAWCMKKDYLFDAEFYGKSIPEGNFKKFDFPIHTFWSIDDTISTEKNTENFWKHIASSKPIGFTKLIPKDVEVKSIGHFGLFKKSMKSKLWNRALEKLEEFNRAA